MRMLKGLARLLTAIPYHGVAMDNSPDFGLRTIWAMLPFFVIMIGFSTIGDLAGYPATGAFAGLVGAIAWFVLLVVMMLAAEENS